MCLSLSGSKIIKEWKETDKKITFCYNEARDNSKFIQAMETCCHALYLDDPVCKLYGSNFFILCFSNLFQTVPNNKNITSTG